MALSAASPFDTVRLAAVLDALPGPVIAAGPDTQVVAANAPARAVLAAIRIGDALALTLRDPDVLDAVRRVLQGGAAEMVFWRDRVPVERAFEVAVTRLDRDDNEPLVLLSLRDLTEARRIERMRADFIANASHELRTPLASMLGFVETLQGAAREDVQARGRFLAIMAEQGRRMARLVDDLLSLSRIEQNLHIQPATPVDLTALVCHVADTLGPLATEAGVTVSVATDGPVTVVGDRDELIRVAENLVENAIKYGCEPGHPAAGRIEVAVARTAREGVLRVTDYGRGIAPHHLPRLTERFYRVDAGKSRAKGGTGLGLALVKHIVARHRGRMTIDSALGEGATVTVTIPLHEGS